MSWINDEYRKLDRSPRALRRFGITVGAVLLALGTLLFLRQRNAGPVLFSFGALLLLAASISPALLRYVHAPWMIFAQLLGRIVTAVILTLFFFLIVTPIGLIQRLCGKRALEFGFRSSGTSYWQTRAGPGVPADYEKQF